MAYRKAMSLLERRGLVENGVLTKYGKAVEALPVEREWGELIVNADDDLLPTLAVMSGIDSLHRMTREGRDLEGLALRGSDHLTAYNVYAEGFRVAGYVGEVYGLPRTFSIPSGFRMGRTSRRAGQVARGRRAGDG
jgi:hypothetical protein